GPLLDTEGRPKVPNDQLLKRGVVVGHQTRQGKVSVVRPRKDAHGRELTGPDGRRLLDDSDENVIGIVLLRKGQESIPALKDVGIIVDSTVILVESIYRHLKSGDYAGLPLGQRILRACGEVEKSLFYSTVIMVCALLPLFTMKGPEGQIFGPMADTYAFALAGALLLALTISPVLCCLLLKNIRPAHDNALVRGLRGFYLVQLRLLLKVRWLAVA